MPIVTQNSDLGLKDRQPNKYLSDVNSVGRKSQFVGGRGIVDEELNPTTTTQGEATNTGLVSSLSSEFSLDSKGTSKFYDISKNLLDRGSNFVDGGSEEALNPSTTSQTEATNTGLSLSKNSVYGITSKPSSFLTDSLTFADRGSQFVDGGSVEDLNPTTSNQFFATNTGLIRNPKLPSDLSIDVNPRAGYYVNSLANLDKGSSFVDQVGTGERAIVTLTKQSKYDLLETPTLFYNSSISLPDRGSKFVAGGVEESLNPTTTNQQDATNTGLRISKATSFDLNGKTPKFFSLNTLTVGRGSKFVRGQGEVEDLNPTTFSIDSATNTNLSLANESVYGITSTPSSFLTDSLTFPDRGSQFVEGGFTENTNPTTFSLESATNTSLTLSKDSIYDLKGSTDNKYSPVLSQYLTFANGGVSNFVTDARFESINPTTFTQESATNTALTFKNSSLYNPSSADSAEYRLSIIRGTSEGEILSPTTAKQREYQSRFDSGFTNFRTLKSTSANGGTLGLPLVISDLPGLDEDRFRAKNLFDRATLLRKAKTDDIQRLGRLLVAQGGRGQDANLFDGDRGNAQFPQPPRNPAGNAFLLNQTLIATQQSLWKGQKAASSGNNLRERVGNVARQAVKSIGDSLLDVGKTITGVISQTAVTGTGTHFIFAPAVGNQYLQKSEGGATGFLNTVTEFTGGGAGSGVDGASQAYYTGRVKIGKIKNKSDAGLAFINLPAGYNDRADGNTIELDSIYDQANPAVVEAQDIIPFRFQIFTPDSFTPTTLNFRSYLKSFNDSYTGNWNSSRYIGRADEVFNYVGFDRGIDFGFSFASHNKDTVKILYEKLNLLASSTAPSYNDTNTFMRGTFVRLTVGDYLVQLPGFFKNVSLSWNTTYPWEVGFDENLDENNIPKVPTVLDVELGFQPIHDFNPSFNQPFIEAGRRATQPETATSKASGGS